jgi:hypothetical protein
MNGFRFRDYLSRDSVAVVVYGGSDKAHLLSRAWVENVLFWRRGVTMVFGSWTVWRLGRMIDELKRIVKEVIMASSE